MVDDDAPRPSRALTLFRRVRQRLTLVKPGAQVSIGALWFVAVFATLIGYWGLNPLVFPTPDEAVVRFAARLIREHGNPVLKLPFPDPEDLAHPRTWFASGDSALPVYAPVILYVYGLLLRLRGVGLWLIALLPASAVGAFAAGTAELLPAKRRWLALLTPALGFVSLYWLVRPWMNLSPVLSCLCWAFYFWTRWHTDERARWLVATTLSVGAAGAIRPDYAGFLLLSAALLMLAETPARWRLVLPLLCAAGALALVPNLILNRLETGHPFRAVYQLALDRQYGEGGGNGLDQTGDMSALSVLRVLMIPMGLPTVHGGLMQFKKYFFSMGPVPFLLCAQLCLFGLCRKKPVLSCTLYAALLLLLAFFTVSRLHGELFGGSDHHGYVHHSIPRYLSPLFLFAALPPILFLGECRGFVLVLGSAVLSAVAASSLYEIYLHQPGSLRTLQHLHRQAEALSDALVSEIPADAMVYSVRFDKVFWPRWRVGIIDDPGATASSMRRAFDAKLPTFVVEPGGLRPLRRLTAALSKRQLRLIAVNARLGLYRLDGRADVR